MLAILFFFIRSIASSKNMVFVESCIWQWHARRHIHQRYKT